MLDITMENGAKISDWLGTAACAGRIGAGLIENVRTDRAQEDEVILLALREAQDYLAQAQEES